MNSEPNNKSIYYKLGQKVSWKNLFGIIQTGTVVNVDYKGVEVKIIHPEDAEYEYDPDYIYWVGFDKIIEE